MSADRQVAQAFVILLAIMLTNPAVGIAQTCERLPSDGSPLSYRFRANVPRCEGMYLAPVVGDTRMALVSLTLGKVSYDAKSDKYLEIKLPADPADKTLIQAVGIPDRLYYRLDVELTAGRSVFRLPLSDVVAPQSILPEQFGIYALRTPGGQTAFIPVHAQGSGVSAQGDVVAVVRPGADVSNVWWRFRAPPTAWASVPGASGLVPRGARLEIVLGKNLPALTTFEVSYLLQGIGRADPFVLLAR